MSLTICKQNIFTYALHILDPWDGVKWGTFFQSMATLYIKFNGMKPTTKMKANILSLHTLLTIGVRPKGENIFSESGRVALQRKAEE